MVQQGTARLGATQMQNINVHIPKLSYEKEDNSRETECHEQCYSL